MSHTNVRPLAKTAPGKSREAGDGPLDPDEEETRRNWLRFRNALGWSQLRCAIELGRDTTTIEAWESPRKKAHSRIPAREYRIMSALAGEKGVESSGRIRCA